MKLRILVAILVAIFVVGLSTVTGAQEQPSPSTTAVTTPNPAEAAHPACPSVHKYRWVLHRAVRYGDAGGNYWARSIPRHSQQRLIRMRRCAATFGGPGDHARMVKLWRVRKHAWNFAHEIDVITPWGEWAIPTYIVMCESGGNYRVPNKGGSGATGAYQIMGSTWYAHGGGRWASAAMNAPDYAQHIVAARIWASGGAGQWSCS